MKIAVALLCTGLGKNSTNRLETLRLEVRKSIVLSAQVVTSSQNAASVEGESE